MRETLLFTERAVRGRALALFDVARYLTPTLWHVGGVSAPRYFVNLRHDDPQCTCEDHTTRNHIMRKHIWAVRYSRHCERCGRTWCARRPAFGTIGAAGPQRCACCGSRNWNWR